MGLPQHSPNLAAPLPQVASLFISYYSSPPVNIFASLIIIIWRQILCQLFSFSCLFKDNIPTQSGNKTKPATGTWCCKYTRAAPAWHKDGSQVLRVIPVSTVLPRNKWGVKPQFAEPAGEPATSRHTHVSPVAEGCTSLDSLNSSEHQKCMYFRVFIFQP